MKSSSFHNFPPVIELLWSWRQCPVNWEGGPVAGVPAPDLTMQRKKQRQCKWRRSYARSWQAEQPEARWARWWPCTWQWCSSRTQGTGKRWSSKRPGTRIRWWCWQMHWQLEVQQAVATALEVAEDMAVVGSGSGHPGSQHGGSPSQVPQGHNAMAIPGLDRKVHWVCQNDEAGHRVWSAGQVGCFERGHPWGLEPAVVHRSTGDQPTTHMTGETLWSEWAHTWGIRGALSFWSPEVPSEESTCIRVSWQVLHPSPDTVRQLWVWPRHELRVRARGLQRQSETGVQHLHGGFWRRCQVPTEDTVRSTHLWTAGPDNALGGLEREAQWPLHGAQEGHLQVSRGLDSDPGQNPEQVGAWSGQERRSWWQVKLQAAASGQEWRWQQRWRRRSWQSSGGDNKKDTIKCRNCGRHHADGACRAKDKECWKCSKKGHISKMCKSTGGSKQNNAVLLVSSVTKEEPLFELQTVISGKAQTVTWLCDTGAKLPIYWATTCAALWDCQAQAIKD